MRASHQRIDNRQSAFDDPAGLEVFAPEFGATGLKSGSDDEAVPVGESACGANPRSRSMRFPANNMHLPHSITQTGEAHHHVVFRHAPFLDQVCQHLSYDLGRNHQISTVLKPRTQALFFVCILANQQEVQPAVAVDEYAAHR